MMPVAREYLLIARIATKSDGGRLPALLILDHSYVKVPLTHPNCLLGTAADVLFHQS